MIVGEKKSQKSYLIVLHFLTMPDEIKKNFELIEKTPEAKFLMQSGSSDKCARSYCVVILNIFDLKLQLINTKNLKEQLGQS